LTEQVLGGQLVVRYAGTYLVLKEPPASKRDLLPEDVVGVAFPVGADTRTRVRQLAD
jgi:hypothetical protein